MITHARASRSRSIDFVDDKWVDTAARPFDPPLTPAGVAQGAALGRRLRSLEGVPPVTKIFVSPLGRTVQTADAAAAELGIDALHVEPGLVEVLDAEWYSCWRCADDDARGDASAASLFMTPAHLKEQVSARVHVGYTPVFTDLDKLQARRRHFAAASDVTDLVCCCGATQITRRNAERWAAMRARLDTTVRALAAAHPDESILLVTHGGPIEAVCRELDPRLSKHAAIKYTCLSVFQEDAAAPKGFTCTLHACAAHANL